jgi:hypothetical protein
MSGFISNQSNEQQASGEQCIDYLIPGDESSGFFGFFNRLVTTSHHEKSQGSVSSALNPVIDLNQESVSVGTNSGTPSWQIQNFYNSTNILTTVTYIVQGVLDQSMGTTLIVDGVSKTINWSGLGSLHLCNTPPLFTGCWDIIQFKILNGSSGVITVFGYVEGPHYYGP